MDYEKLIDYLERKTADTHELQAASAIIGLRQRVAELEKERDEWEGNAGQWEQEYYKVSKERDALKKLYESSEESVLALKETRNRLAEERDKATQYWQIAEGRCDALMKQRDELLAALGSGGRHCNDDTPHSNLCEAIIDSKEADLGQGLDPFWKWAFRRGFHEAETSYKVDITTLEQQRDELLAALKEAIDAVRVFHGPVDWETYRDHSPEMKRWQAAIASVKEKQNAADR